MPLVDKGEVTARLSNGEPKCIVEYHMGITSIRAVIGCGVSPEESNHAGCV